MKTTKRLSIVLVGIMLILSVAGCGKTQKADEIRIGSSFALTGQYAVYGIAAKKGVELAIKEYNEAGGVLGKKIKFIVEDNKGVEVEASNAFSKLADKDGIDVFIGSDISGTTLAIADLAVEKKMPMLTPTATAMAVTEKGDNVFRTCYIDPFQGSMMGKFASTDLNAKTAAILYNVGSDYSEGIAKKFEEEFEANGGKIVSMESYNKDEKDFKSVLTKINNEKPDVLFIPDYYEIVGLIIRQIREVGIQSTLIGVDGWDGVLDQLKDFPEAAEGIYFANHYAVDDPNPVVQEFVSKFTKEYGETPNALAALGYDGARVMLEAIKSAGSTDSAAVIEALKKTDVNLVTGNITFDEKRNPVKSIAVIKVVDNKHTAYTVINP